MLEFTIVPIRSDDGRMAGVAAILRDVTRSSRRSAGSGREVAAFGAQRAAAAAAAPLGPGEVPGAG